jgi:hypothetical protein
MKLVRASRAKGPANRGEAWACVMSNLALPGAGSLAAGKAVGYFQLALAATGFVVSTITGIQMFDWMLGNWARINQSTGDPFQNLIVIWQEIKWPLAGLAIFFVALLWAGFTSWQIYLSVPKSSPPPPPPILS